MKIKGNVTTTGKNNSEIAIAAQEKDPKVTADENINSMLINSQKSKDLQNTMERNKQKIVKSC